MNEWKLQSNLYVTDKIYKLQIGMISLATYLLSYSDTLKLKMLLRKSIILIVILFYET